MVHLMDVHQGWRRLSPEARCAAADAMRAGGMAFILLGQPGSEPLLHPRLAQVQAVKVHELAVGWTHFAGFVCFNVPTPTMQYRSQFCNALILPSARA